MTEITIPPKRPTNIVFYYALKLSYAERFGGISIVGASANIGPSIYYFSTERQLENFRKKYNVQGQWGIEAITIKVCRELIKNSKKKVK